MQIKLTGKYVNEMVEFFVGKYSNGRLAVRAMSSGMPIATLTINLPNEELKGTNKSFFKDFDENEGILECLEEQKVLKRTGRFGKSGYCEYPEVEWNEKLLYN